MRYRSADARSFQAKYADGAFLAGDTMEEMRDLSRDVHERAAANGRECKTYSMLTVVQDETEWPLGACGQLDRARLP